MATTILAEHRFAQPGESAFADVQSRLAPCLRVREAVWVRSYVTEDGFVGVFEAADAEVVRRAFRSAGVGFERVWRAEQR
jgi:hypothetical protein